MPHSDFVHLRVHSAYSLSEGAIKLKDLVKLAAKKGMPAVAITDTGNLFGALEFSLAAADAGVQPIVGCLLALRRSDGAPRPGLAPAPDQILLLAQSQAGYENLLKLVSKAFLETESHEQPQIDIRDLEACSDGLIALTGGPAGWVGRLLGEGQEAAAEEALLQLKAIFPNRLYVELMRHGLAAEDKIEPPLVDLAFRHDLPLVATNDAYFATPDLYDAHDVLLCIAQGATLSKQDRRRLTREHYFKSAEDMRALFEDLPEAVDNTLVIARRCAFMVETRKPILPPFESADGRDEITTVQEMARSGLEVRLAAAGWRSDLSAEAREAVKPAYWERLEYELGIITSMGFAGYFLIVADFIQWAKEQDIPVGPGRGSGAGSLVAWALTITDLDPLRFALLFERFLNPERISMPDFDIDFCQDRRDEVIRYVQGKYGQDRVAQIITFGKLQARAVLRDVGRVMEMPYGQIDRISKLVPNNPANPVTLEQAIQREPQLQEMRKSDEQVARLLATGMQLEGLYRHASTHAAGVVIGDRPLEQLVPLYRDPRSSMPVTQFNMKYVEQAGLVKFDFLGLTTLTILKKAQNLLLRRGISLDVNALPLDDKKTYEMMSRGDATGVFQFESGGMRDLLRDAKPDVFEDLVALVALYRPGPMENIPKYVACKHGRDKPEFMHETIDPVVKDTYGIIIYQEQVLQIAQVFAGYTLGQADILRRAMGKKIKEEMAAERARFTDGAVQKGISAKQASYVFDLVDKFAGYGFNKAHSAGYALVAYQTAYLKANYPVEFFAATMTLAMANTDKLNQFRQELAKIGVPLLPPDVNKSGAEFGVELQADGSPAVRYALAAVKNVGVEAMRGLVAEREAGGPYRDLADFAKRIDARAINKRQLEQLVAAGGFDSLNPNRAQCFGGIEAIIRLAGATASDRESGQFNLLGDAPASSALALPKLADWPSNERLQKEFEAIGFYLSAHPLDAYGKAMKRLGVTSQAELGRRVGSEAQRIKLAGIVLGKQERVSARGNRFAFLQMSDTTGAFEVTLFAEMLNAARDLLTGGRPLLVTAEARADEGGVRLTALQIQPLDEAAAKTAAGMRIRVVDQNTARQLASTIKPGGKGRIWVVVPAEEKEVEIALKDFYTVSPQLLAQITAIPGVAAVEEL